MPLPVMERVCIPFHEAHDVGSVPLKLFPEICKLAIFGIMLQDGGNVPLRELVYSAKVVSDIILPQESGNGPVS